jgi:SAM-dependent methyltransferase
MKPELVERLKQINREFYSAFAASFSETRSEAGREVQVILPYIADGARVLDIGCGNGRVAALLAEHRRDVMYVGIDASQEQISNFKFQISNVKGLKVSFAVADIMQPDWIYSLLPLGESPDGGGWSGPALSTAEGTRGFDCILLLAVLHHIPGSDVRARIMRQVCELLAPGGRTIVSAWQFMDNARMRKKIVPWSAVGIDECELEPGDALLDWKHGGAGLRYCHWIGEDEMLALAAQAGMKVVETFRAGGREGNLSLYGVLRAKTH